MTFIPLEAEEKSRHREIRWVSLEGKPSMKKMTSGDACLTQVQGIVARKLLTCGQCGICSFAIRTPFNLVNFAPELDSGKALWTGKDLLRMPLMVGAWGGCQKIHKALQGFIYRCQV